MKDLEIIMNLGLTLNNGECLELIKKERGYIESHIEQMKKDKETKFDAMKHKVNLLCAYNVLIESFEQYLGHEKQYSLQRNSKPRLNVV